MTFSGAAPRNPADESNGSNKLKRTIRECEAAADENIRQGEALRERLTRSGKIRAERRKK
jgi:hypothetical protein